MSIPAATTARSSHGGHGRAGGQRRRVSRRDKQTSRETPFGLSCVRFVCGLSAVCFVGGQKPALVRRDEEGEWGRGLTEGLGGPIGADHMTLRCVLLHLL